MVPFSMGNRACIGNAFGQAETTLTLAAVAARWRLRPVPGAWPKGGRAQRVAGDRAADDGAQPASYAGAGGVPGVSGPGEVRAASGRRRLRQAPGVGAPHTPERCRRTI